MKNSFSDSARLWRAKLFIEQLKPENTDAILDLGGGDGKHMSKVLAQKDASFTDVTISDILSKDLAYARETFGYKTVQLEESDRLPFEDKSFDIVFCNSVLEHVTIPKEQVWELKDTKEFKKKSWERQQQFAAEIKRVSKSYFVQTPNRYFIIESHTWLPGLIAWVPRSVQIPTIKFFNSFWPKKTAPDWNLLTYSQMQELFPEATIYREKSMGFTKSLIAIRKKN